MGPLSGMWLRTHNSLGACGLTVGLALLTAMNAAAPAWAGPEVEVGAFVGDLAGQEFIRFRGELRQIGTDGDTTRWQCRLLAEAAPGREVLFEASSTTRDGRERWSYRLVNNHPNATLCDVTFPIIRDVQMGDSWDDDRILWPSMYVGAMIDDLTSPEAFEAQAKQACKGVPHLHGLYAGDLCLPLFAHMGSEGLFAITVMDPTHEVVTFKGYREAEGMRYQLTTHPRVPAGKEWAFEGIEVTRQETDDWHPIADRYRAWLSAQGLAPTGQPRGDIATFMYSRWDGLRTDEVIRWARATGAQDVCLWVNLYGRGDQYYPCYFPPPKMGVAGMTGELAKLRQAGVSPYFYTNGYLLSPFQTHQDALQWTKKAPERYPGWLAKTDVGYADVVSKFRREGNEFAGDWLQTPGGILPLRVRRVSFQWGEFPIYYWHQRPFWAACIAAPQWRKLFGDTARLHARMGARGVFIDQVAAMHPELCAASGHGHDEDSFGLWNRAYLRLLEQVQQAGDALEPGFFIEAEGAADLYAKYINRYLCHFGPRDPESRRWPTLLRYTVPWARFDEGNFGYGDPATMTAHVERTLRLGCVFRAGGGVPTGDDDPDDPRLSGPAMKLLKAGIAARRRLAPFIDGGTFRDDVGLRSEGCAEVTWFDSPVGVLIAAQATETKARVTLSLGEGRGFSQARRLQWQTGKETPVGFALDGSELVVRDLSEGLNLVLVTEA